MGQPVCNRTRWYKGAVIAAFEVRLRADSALMTEAKVELHGKILACCSAPTGGVGLDRPFICHAQVLRTVANEP